MLEQGLSDLLEQGSQTWRHSRVIRRGVRIIRPAPHVNYGEDETLTCEMLPL